MIDPATTRPGDWIGTPQGIAMVYGFYDANRFLPEEQAAEGHVYGPTGRIGVSYKVLADWNGKPKLRRYMDNTCAPGGCDPATPGDLEMVETLRDGDPDVWNTFRSLATSSLQQATVLRGGDHLMPDVAAVRAEIETIRTCLDFPADGLTMNAIDLTLRRNGIAFDYWARQRSDLRNQPEPYTLSFDNTGFAQTPDGENLFFGVSIQPGKALT